MDNLIDITTSLINLTSVNINQRHEIIPILQVLHPDIDKYIDLDCISTEGILSRAKEILMSIWNRIYELVKKVINFFKRESDDGHKNIKKEKDRFQQFEEDIKSKPLHSKSHELVYNVVPLSLIKERQKILSRIVSDAHSTYIDPGAEVAFVRSVTQDNFSLYKNVGITFSKTHYTIEFVPLTMLDEYKHKDGMMTIAQHEQEYLKYIDVLTENINIHDKCLLTLSRYRKELDVIKQDISQLSQDSDKAKILTFKLNAIQTLKISLVRILSDLKHIKTATMRSQRRIENQRKALLKEETTK